jgi:hypothetical protein
VLAMKFKEALKAAGLANPGRTTWCGKATDGTPVFTIWSHDIRKINGRLFVWWDHNNAKRGFDTPKQISQQRTFVRLAAASVGKKCRAVIIHRKPGTWLVASADYPDQRKARADIRVADIDALQFIIELLPPD